MTVRNHPGFAAAEKYMNGTLSRMTAPQMHYKGSKAVCDTGYLGTKVSTSPTFYGNSCLTSLRDGFVPVGNRVCHGAFGAYFGPHFRADQRHVTPDYAVSSLWFAYKNRTHKAKMYWDWMFDPKVSPWRNLFQNGELEVHGSNIMDGKLPSWLTLKLTPDTSSQLIMSFMMASRIPFEHTAHLDAWYEFVSNGVDPSLAIMLIQIGQDVTFDKATATFTFNTNGYTTYNQYAFSAPTNHEVMLKNMIEATPYLCLSHQTVTGTYQYHGVNGIWFDPNYAKDPRSYSRSPGVPYSNAIKWLNTFKADAKSCAKVVESKVGKPKAKHTFAATAAFMKVYRNTSSSGSITHGTSIQLDLGKLNNYVKKVLDGSAKQAA